MSKTALLVMDLQNGIVGRVSGDEGYLPRIQGVIATARKAGIQIVYVVVKFREDFPEVSSRNKMFAMLKTGAMPFTEGNEAVEIHKDVAPQKGDIVITKRRVGAFSGSDLDTVLRALEITHLVLTGLATSGVVLSTLRLAADLDFEITVLSDCCGDRDEEVHRVLVEKVFPAQAEVMSASEWQQKQA